MSAGKYSIRIFSEKVEAEDTAFSITDKDVTVDIEAVRIPGFILGDIDDDGEVTVMDATFAQRFATRVPVPYPEEQMLHGDVDGDGEVTVLDATFIQRYATRVRVPYPIGEKT